MFGHRRHDDNSFFELLTKAAHNLVEGSALLAQILGAPSVEREALRNELHAVENSSDEITHEFMKQVNLTFVTPLDRDDLSTLVSRLDDCMDLIDEVGNFIAIYKIESLPESVTKQVEVLQKCAELTVQAMPNLKTLEDLREYWVEINRLENQGDQIYMRGLVQLFDEVTDPIELIKQRDVLEKLESACDAYESLASTIESIAIKES